MLCQLCIYAWIYSVVWPLPSLVETAGQQEAMSAISMTVTEALPHYRGKSHVMLAALLQAGGDGGEGDAGLACGHKTHGGAHAAGAAVPGRLGCGLQPHRAHHRLRILRLPVPKQAAPPACLEGPRLSAPHHFGLVASCSFDLPGRPVRQHITSSGIPFSIHMTVHLTHHELPLEDSLCVGA